MRRPVSEIIKSQGIKMARRMPRWSGILVLLAVAAALAQGQTIEELIQGLSSPDAVTRANCANKLGSLGQAAAPAIPALVRLLGDNHRLEWHRVPDKNRPIPLIVTKTGDTSPGMEAADALEKIGDASTAALLTAVANRNREVRANASSALLGIIASAAERGVVHPQLADTMLRLLDDEHWEVRTNAAAAVGRLRDPRALDKLLRMAANVRENEYVRSSAASALAQAKDPRAGDALVSLLSDANPSVQMTAVSLAQQLKDPRAVEPLLRILDRPEPACCALHMVAIHALTELGAGRRALEPLVRIIESFVSETRKRGSFSESSYQAAEASAREISRITGAAGPGCSESEPIIDCQERRARHWRAWLSAEGAKK